MTNRVLILEDMPDTQRWLRDACIMAFPDADVMVVNSIVKAVESLETHTFELALIDLELPDGKGNTFIPTLLASCPDCLSIVVTIYADEDHLLPSLMAGAKGYILKDQSRQRIAGMLKQAVEGELPLSPGVAKLVLSHFSANHDMIDSEALTQREQQVLTLIAGGAKTPAVAETLHISKYTVEDHLKHIYQKLNISSRAEAALAAKRIGLI